MVFFALLILSFLVLKGFVLVEEELLIILASIFWIDLAGSFIREILETELVYKSDVIKENYLFFLNLKKELILEIKELHESRLVLEESFYRPLQEYFVRYFLEEAVNSFLYNSVILDLNNRMLEIKGSGLLLIKENQIIDNESILSMVETNEYIDIK